MSTKNIILKAKRSVALPKDIAIGVPINIPAGAAIRSGLAFPPMRLKNGKRLPAIPAGQGVFAKWAIEVMDRNGKKVPFLADGKKVRKLERPVHSFNRNFGFFIRGFMQNPDGTLNVNETLTDDSGASFQCRLKGLTTMPGAITVISGLAKIMFGNSSAALDTTQFALQGTLLGVTTEAPVVVTLVTEDSVQTIFTVVGQITNTTGGSFTVQEMGIFPELGNTAGVANNTTMMLRDLTGVVVVNNGQTIIGTYTFTVTT
jgi:hypothetical protein